MPGHRQCEHREERGRQLADPAEREARGLSIQLQGRKSVHPHRSLRVGDAFDVARHVLGVGHAVIHRAQAVAASREVLRGIEHASAAGKVSCDICCGHAAMVGQKAVPNVQDLRPLVRAARLDGKVTLRIRAHGAVVEIGRADAQESIIDDHHLGVHHRVGCSAAILDMRVDETHPFPDASIRQRVHEADAPVAHGASLDPGLVVLRSDQQGLECGLLLHAPGDALGHDARGEELVLDVKALLGRID